MDDALGRFVDGEPEPQDGPALAKAMAADARFAEEVRRLLAIDGLLHQAADADPAAFAESIRTSLAAEDDGTQFTQAVADRLKSTAPLAGRRPRHAGAALDCRRRGLRCRRRGRNLAGNATVAATA